MESSGYNLRQRPFLVSTTADSLATIATSSVSTFTSSIMSYPSSSSDSGPGGLASAPTPKCQVSSWWRTQQACWQDPVPVDGGQFTLRCYCNSTRYLSSSGSFVEVQLCSNEAHLTAAKRVLRYLKRTINLSLPYKQTENSDIVGFSDADWASDMDNRHSTTGNVFMMAGNAICWLSQKQSTVALSTAESEYIPLSSASQEAVWLRQLFRDIKGDCVARITVMEDNQGTIAMTNNQTNPHRRTKHIDIRYHFVREQVQKGTLLIKYCYTKDMLADLLTKPLARGQFEQLRCKLGMA